MSFSKNDGFFWGGWIGLAMFVFCYNVFYLDSLSADYVASEENFEDGAFGGMLASLITGGIGSLFGTNWIPWDEWSKKNDDELKEIFEKKIKCRSCNASIKGRNAMERSARGVAGAGVGGGHGGGHGG